MAPHGSPARTPSFLREPTLEQHRNSSREAQVDSTEKSHPPPAGCVPPPGPRRGRELAPHTPRAQPGAQRLSLTQPPAPRCQSAVGTLNAPHVSMWCDWGQRRFLTATKGLTQPLSSPTPAKCGPRRPARWSDASLPASSCASSFPGRRSGPGCWPGAPGRPPAPALGTRSTLPEPRHCPACPAPSHSGFS